MLFAGKIKQWEVLVQEDAGIENTHEEQDVKRISEVSTPIFFFFCRILLNA